MAAALRYRHSDEVILGSNVLQGTAGVEGGAALQGKCVKSHKHVIGSTLKQSSKYVHSEYVMQGSMAADTVIRGDPPAPGL